MDTAQQTAADTPAESRLARLRSFRSPTVAEIEEMLWLEEHLKWRNTGGPARRVVRELAPLRDP